jgi:hypothetical protein
MNSITNILQIIKSQNNLNASYMLLGEKSTTSSGQHATATFWPLDALDLGVITAIVVGKLATSDLTATGNRSREGACHKKTIHQQQTHNVYQQTIYPTVN